MAPPKSLLVDEERDKENVVNTPTLTYLMVSFSETQHYLKIL